MHGRGKGLIYGLVLFEILRKRDVRMQRSSEAPVGRSAFTVLSAGGPGPDSSLPAISSLTRKVYGVVTVKETSRRTECHEEINSMGKRALAGYNGKLLAPALVNLWVLFWSTGFRLTRAS